ncbi:hypothetical protein [Nostoc sp.]|uniref:hypothetical protein n=1 Tax=Nostoc sp. TaxID=1180 RepID=UPI003593615E
MSNITKFIIPCFACAGISIVAAGVDHITPNTTARFSLSPGFKRRVAIVHPGHASKTLKCYVNADYRNRKPIIEKAYGNQDNQYPLIIENDFIKPIVITIKATNSDSDPVILIRSLEGKIFPCQDYQHDNLETLHTGRKITDGFVPKKGNYLIEIWSYFKPADKYQIEITEEN